MQFLQWLRDIIAAVGFFLTFLGTYLTIRSGEGSEIIHDELIIVLSTLLILFAAGFFHFCIAYYLSRSVINGRQEINEAHKTIFRLNEMNKENPQTWIKGFRELCTHLANGMKKYHTQDISICIHYINQDSGNRMYVMPLSRCACSSVRSGYCYTTTDYIDANSDFNHILTNIQKPNRRKIYYFSNFLPLKRIYLNTHIDESAARRHHWPVIGIFHRLFRWSLPYRSSIVVPIIYDDTTESRLLGFFSVDSPKMYAFSRKYDIPLMQEIASDIAYPINRFHKKHLTHSHLINESKHD